MEKKNFLSLIMGTVGGILFGIGMCICMLPEWNAFRQGIVVSSAGAVVLLAMLIVRRKMEGKPAIQLNAKAFGTVALGIAGALALGVGMWLTLVSYLLVPGIIVGIAGIVLLMSLIPICKGLK